MKYFAALVMALLLFFIPIISQAQSVDSIMRSSGRIYVVIVVIILILTGLILYLVRIEKKLNKLEKQNK